MKKIIFLLFLALISTTGFSQCIRTYTLNPVASDNSGFVQQLQSCAWTSSDVVTVTNLLLGSEYTFTCSNTSLQRYITVTDAENNLIVHGPSPLIVSEVANTTLRLHLSDNADCLGTSGCNVVTMQLSLSCPFPTALSIQDITTNSANFTWDGAGSETTWEVIALPATSAAPANDLLDGVTEINGEPEFLATLLPATTYKFYYRAVCSPTEKSPWNSSATFTTLCEAVTYFSNGFDSSTNLPNCFSKIGEQGMVSVQSQSAAASLPNVLVMGTNGILAFPSVSNFNDNTNRLKFKLRCIYGLGGSVQFGYFANAQDPLSFVVLETFNATSLTAYDEYTFAPDSSVATGNFGFKHSSGDAWVIIDDLIWEPIPNCPDVTLLKTDAFTSNTATLSWTSGQNSFEVVYGVAADVSNPNSLTPQTVQQNSVALSNLQPGKAYKVWVRSVCANNQEGAWIGPRTFTTTCAPVTTFSENFNTSSSIPACFTRVGSGGNAYIQSSALNLSSYEDGNAGNVMSYGMVSLPPVSNAAAGTHRLKFNIKSPQSVGGIVELGYLTNPENLASFTSVQAFTSNSTSNQTVIYIPVAGAITAQVLAFRHTGNPSYSVLIDDVVWETAPNCGDVTAIQSSEVSNSSAKIVWTGTTETNWEVAYGATSITDPNTLTAVAVSTDSNTVLSNLSESTTYKVWVRSNCNAQGFGAWIGPIQFTTSCNPVTNFSEGFDLSSNLPNCWTQNGGFIQSGNSASGTNSLYMSSLNVLMAPFVSNASAGTHRMTFKAKAMYGLGGTIQVGYLTSYNDPATFVLLQSFTPSSTASFDTFYVNLGTAPLTGYLALRHSGASFNPVAVDDVVWEALPNCEDVSGLTVDLVTHNSATVSWSAQTSTAWQIVYTDLDNDSNPSDLEIVSTNATNYTFVALVPNTSSKYWVRSVCAEGEYGAWVGPKVFTTTCDPIVTLPWFENFENTQVPNIDECWTKDGGNWITVDQSAPVFAPFVPTKANSGNNYLRIYNGADNSYIWTAGFELEANVAYDFSTFVQGDGYDGWKVEILYNNSPKVTGATLLGAAYDIPAGMFGQQPYVQLKREFTPTVAGVYFFAVRVNENSTQYPYYIAFDDFALEEQSLGNPIFNVNTIKVYPNPVKDFLYLSNMQNSTDVAVFNLLGQQVIIKTVNANNDRIDMSGLAAGTYLVKLTSDNQVKTIKIVKE